MKKIYGKTEGIRKSTLQELESLYRVKISPYEIIDSETAKRIALLSRQTKRQIAVLIDRSGSIEFVIVGTNQQIMIPDLSSYRTSSGRLKGLRCIHTHLKRNEQLSNDDLTDLMLLKMDLMCAITIDEGGKPEKLHLSYINPKKDKNNPYYLESRRALSENEDCLELINSIENELSKSSRDSKHKKKDEKAILLKIGNFSKYEALSSLKELEALAATANIEVLETVFQKKKIPDKKFLMGKGKLNELSISILHQDASMVIFDQELNPSQLNTITKALDIKVIDRTQLILDIFASRAQTKEGKLQVALAQQKYLMPRLIKQQASAFSRLAGGIGGRGPGETKLEIDRRRARESISRLEKELKKIQKNRSKQRAKREKNNLPTISIVGYTNAGKSTLLNTLTQSSILSENKLFATLDPTSRRLRFPKEREVIITDTVGFIRDLPEELKTAFKATLEELESADILLHVVDISNPDHEKQIEAVNKILSELGLDHIEQVLALNKADKISKEEIETLEESLGGIAISAKKKQTLSRLYNTLDNMLDRLF